MTTRHCFAHCVVLLLVGNDTYVPLGDSGMDMPLLIQQSKCLFG